jgi:serine acetyltransferase
MPTLVGTGASIGSGAAILGGVGIGPHAMIGARAVAVDAVPDGATVAGVPVRLVEHGRTRSRRG